MLFRLITLLIFFINSAYAKIAVIDMRKIEDESLVAKDLKEKIIKASKELENTVQVAKNKIDMKVADLQKIAPTISPESVEKKRNEIQKEFLSIESSIQQRDAELQEKRISALEEINDKIKLVSAKIAKQKNIDLVLVNTLIVYYNDSGDIDITKDVITELNKEIKKSSFNP